MIITQLLVYEDTVWIYSGYWFNFLWRYHHYMEVWKLRDLL